MNKLSIDELREKRNKQAKVYVAAGTVATVFILGMIVFVAWHFISKFW